MGIAPPYKEEAFFKAISKPVAERWPFFRVTGKFVLDAMHMQQQTLKIRPLRKVIADVL